MHILLKNKQLNSLSPREALECEGDLSLVHFAKQCVSGQHKLSGGWNVTGLSVRMEYTG